MQKTIVYIFCFSTSLTYGMESNLNTTIIFPISGDTISVSVNLPPPHSTIEIVSDYINDTNKSKHKRTEYTLQLLTGIEFFFSNIGNLSTIENAFINRQSSYNHFLYTSPKMPKKNSHTNYLIFKTGKHDRNISIPTMLPSKITQISLIHFRGTQQNEHEKQSADLIQQMINPNKNNNTWSIDFRPLEKFFNENLVVDF